MFVYTKLHVNVYIYVNKRFWPIIEHIYVEGPSFIKQVYISVFTTSFKLNETKVSSILKFLAKFH